LLERVLNLGNVKVQLSVVHCSCD